MRFLIISAIVIGELLSPILAWADCDWTSIEQQGNKYIYSEECHAKVGIMVKDLKDREAQVIELTKAVTLKDLALEKADKRIMNWREESYKQFDYLQTQKRLSSYSKWLYVGGGFGLAILSVWAAGQLRN